MPKISSNKKVIDFLKLPVKTQIKILGEKIYVYEKYDGIKLSVILDKSISPFKDCLIVSYKGFRIYPFEYVTCSWNESYGYAQFTEMWDVLNDPEVLEGMIRESGDSDITEFIFEFVIKKPSLTTEYEEYGEMIYLGCRPAMYDYKNGIVNISSDFNFISKGFMPSYMRPSLIISGHVYKINTLNRLADECDSEFGGKVEGIVFTSDHETFYRIVNPYKRTREYRLEKANKYFFKYKEDKDAYDAHVESIVEKIQNISIPASSFEDTLHRLFDMTYEYDIGYYKINGVLKDPINIKDDVYLKLRKNLINRYKLKAEDPIENIPIEKNPSLTIIRGLPGSGKTTMAYDMISESNDPIYLFEADHFFLDKDGNYKFDASKSSYAHAWCFNSMVKTLYRGSKVIIANTFTTWKEIYPYLEYCVDNDIECVIIEASGKFKNVHDVPEDVLEKMKDRWVSTELIIQMYNILKKKESK